MPRDPEALFDDWRYRWSMMWSRVDGTWHFESRGREHRCRWFRPTHCLRYLLHRWWTRRWF